MKKHRKIHLIDNSLVTTILVKKKKKYANKIRKIFKLRIKNRMKEEGYRDPSLQKN